MKLLTQGLAHSQLGKRKRLASLLLNVTRMRQKHKDQEADIPADELGPPASLKDLHSSGKWASSCLLVSRDLTTRDAEPSAQRNLVEKQG